METLPLTTMLYIGANLDFFFVILVLLQKYKIRDILIGFEIGVLIVFGLSAAAGQLIQSLVPDWTIGFLGLIPIYMGIKGSGSSSSDDKSKNTKNKTGILAVLLIYLISCGADNVAIYIPVLATMTLNNILINTVFYIILTAITLALTYLFDQLPLVKKIFSKWGDPLGRIIYILIGLFVIIETGLITELIHLF